MKIFYGFLSVCILSGPVTYGQSLQKTFPAKPPEEKEIKADNNVGKEIQQNQLKAVPQQIDEPKTSLQSGRKRTLKKRKPARKPNS